jgi:leader peptidase (prepilin peptidase)/N-methyltransferase
MLTTGAAEAALAAAVLAMGLAAGSFLNVVIYRLPREGLSVTRPRRSFCPSCGRQIRWYDNLPVLSWLILRGKCRGCREPISFRYPLVELLSAALAVSLFALEGPTPRFLCYYIFTLSLTAVAFIDLEFTVIHDILVWPVVIIGLACAVLFPTPLTSGITVWDRLLDRGWGERVISLGGAVAGYLLGFLFLYLCSKAYRLWRGRDGLGSGDPPLMGLIGTFLGWTAVFPVLLLSALTGLIAVVGLLAAGRRPGKGRTLNETPIPFGPFLALAAVIWLFYGLPIKAWYFSLMMVP